MSSAGDDSPIGSTHPDGRDMRPLRVRRATLADCRAIADIYRHYVDNTVATFDYVAPDVAAWEAKVRAVETVGRPFLVAVGEGVGADAADAPDEVVGFAYLGPFRDKAAYDQTAEDTIYIRSGTEGRGVGSKLMAELLAAADPTNVRQIVAVIAADGGAGSIALHAKFGFDEVGRLRSVGFKHDRWVDCVYMQRAVS
ncbi:GNAT family N-acetyltransferase [Gordonia sinesedis]